jgi:hypothetical protein
MSVVQSVQAGLQQAAGQAHVCGQTQLALVTHVEHKVAVVHGVVLRGERLHHQVFQLEGRPRHKVREPARQLARAAGLPCRWAA